MTRRAALAAVDEAGIARLLLELLAVPSVTGSAAESDGQHLLAGHAERLGLEVDLWSMDLPALRGHPDFPGGEAARDEAWDPSRLALRQRPAALHRRRDPDPAIRAG